MSRFKELFPGINSTNVTGKRRVLGIDLGTTISVAADLKWDPGKPEEIEASCLELQQETLQGIYTNHLLPSVVALYNNQLSLAKGLND